VVENADGFEWAIDIKLKIFESVMQHKEKERNSIVTGRAHVLESISPPYYEMAKICNARRGWRRP
jgi:hypothetical protein